MKICRPPQSEERRRKTAGARPYRSTRVRLFLSIFVLSILFLPVLVCPFLFCPCWVLSILFLSIFVLSILFFFHFVFVHFVGLGPGSSSQYSMYWQRHMPVHWTRPVHWWFQRTDRGFAATPAPPRLVKGTRRRRPRWAPLEAPCRRHVFTRFGFTRAKKYVVFGPCFKCNLVVD